MKQQIVKLDIVDTDVEFETPILATYYLVNPDMNKLDELKEMIEHRLDYMCKDDLSDEEIEQSEKFCDDIWGNIYNFIHENFTTLDIDNTYEIEY